MDIKAEGWINLGEAAPYRALSKKLSFLADLESKSYYTLGNFLVHHQTLKSACICLCGLV
jgi:hypothetical protein